MNNLYLLTQSSNNDYDTYDSAVVCASSEDEARNIYPDGSHVHRDDGWYFVYSDGHFDGTPDNYTWAEPKDVQITLIGTAHKSIKKGEVICASFNAG